MRPQLAAALALTLTAALPAASASAAVTRTARFDVTLTGSYSTTGVTTETGCFTFDSAGHEVLLPPQSGGATEQTTFASARTNAVVVSRTARRSLVAGRLHRGRTLPLRIRVVRTSSLGQSGSVRACRPASANDRTPSDCATRSRTFAADLYGARTGVGLGFEFIRRASLVYQPNDIFDNCPLGPAQAWFGFFDHAVAHASPTRLFNPRVRRIVLTARRSGRRTAREGASTGTATYRERYTLTLRRRG